jgi:hypothetical protein
METEVINLAHGKDIALSNECSFDRKKCWMMGRFCIWASGRAKLFGSGNDYEVEVSGEAGATGIGKVAFSKRVKLAPKCYKMNLVSSLSIVVCFENLDLSKKRFTMVIKACADLPVVGTQCFTVYSKDVVIGAASELTQLKEGEPVPPSGIAEFAFEVIEDPVSCESCSNSQSQSPIPVLCFGWSQELRRWTPLPGSNLPYSPPLP